MTVRLGILALELPAAARNRLFESLRRDEGQAFVEYALVLLLIAIALAALTQWGTLTTAVGKVTTAINNA